MKFRKCFLCESLEHQIRDCPNRQTVVAKPAMNTPAPRERPGPTGKPKVLVRVYVFDKTDVEGSSEVVEGTPFVTGKPAKVLIDPGFMHSFIRPRFIKGTDLKLETLPYTV